jgi:uncharacterized protein DUF4339
MSVQASQTQWYLAREGQQYGPLSEAEMARFIELGHLQPTDLLWREGFPDWRPALVVFPGRKPGGAALPRPGSSPMQQSARDTGHRGGSRALVRRVDGPAAEHFEMDPRDDERFDEDRPRSNRRGGSGRFRRAARTLLLLGVIGAAGWFAYVYRAQLTDYATALSSSSGSEPRVDLPSAQALEVPPLKGLGGPPGAVDATLQTTALWRVLKREFPDWYAERLKEIGTLTAQNKDEGAIAQQMARALVALRRQQVNYALAASFPRLKLVATTFYENLVQLRKQSSEMCFDFISQGEASPSVVALLQGSRHTAHLQAQLTAVFEAIAEGRKTTRVYPQPRKIDYDWLAGELGKRGWSQDDMRLFSDERALASAGPEKVCQLVHDWFAAQLAIKDNDMQLRLLVDSLKPVVAG